MFTKMNQTQSTKKPFCKVCQDAGKDEKEYTSHSIKNERGTVTCPTLLEQNCRYCFKQGHTIKYCPTINKNKKEEKKIESRNNYFNSLQNKNKENKNKENKKTNKNNYQALCDDTSSDEENKNKNKKQNKIKDQYPSLNNYIPTKPLPLSYKNIIQITKDTEDKQKRQEEEEEIFKRLNIKKIIKDEIKVVQAPIHITNNKRSWAEAYSSDEDDDDEEEENNFRSTYVNPYDSD
jgi:hypothetical protein